MQNFIFRLLLSLLFTMSLGSIAFAQTVYYVDAAKGNNANAGTHPWTALADLTDAHTAAVNGDRIHLESGTYNGFTESKGLHVVGRGTVTVVSTAMVVSGTAASTFENIRFTGGVTISGNAAHTFKNCTFENNGGTALTFSNTTNAVNGVSLFACTFQDANIGISKLNTTNIDGLDIIRCSFTGGVNGINFPNDGASASLVQNVNIRNCLFDAQTAQCIYTESLSASTLKNISAKPAAANISAAIELNLTQANAYSNVNLTSILVARATATGIGIQIAAASGASLDNVSIEGSKFTNCLSNIVFRDAVTNMTVQYCDLRNYSPTGFAIANYADFDYATTAAIVNAANNIFANATPTSALPVATGTVSSASNILANYSLRTGTVELANTMFVSGIGLEPNIPALTLARATSLAGTDLTLTANPSLTNATPTMYTFTHIRQGATTAGDASVVMNIAGSVTPNVAGLTPGMILETASGSFPPGTTIASIDVPSNTVTFSNTAATNTSPEIFTFYEVGRDYFGLVDVPSGFDPSHDFIETNTPSSEGSFDAAFNAAFGAVKIYCFADDTSLPTGTPYNNTTVSSPGAGFLDAPLVLSGSNRQFSACTLDNDLEVFAIGASDFTLNGQSLRVSDGSNISLNASAPYSSLEITGTGALAASLLNPTAGTFENLTFNRAGTYNLPNVSVNGILSLQAGSFNLNGNTLTLNGFLDVAGGNLVGTATSTVVVNGDGPTCLGASTFALATSFTLSQLTINRNGSLRLGSNIDLSNTGTATLSKGTLDLNGNDLSLGSTGSLVEDRANNYIVFDYTATTENSPGGSITVTNRNVDNGTAPVTDIAGLGLAISDDGAASTVNISRQHYRGDLGKGIRRIYHVNGTPSGNLKLTINYAEAELASIPEADLEMFRYYTSPTPAAWETQAATPDAGTNSVTLDGTVTAYSSWTLGDQNSPLPVNLLSFSGKMTENGTAQLEWTTASEQNSDYFVLERSLDAENFQAIGRVQAAGNSNAQIDYKWLDAELRELPTEVVYYRLRQYDQDGSGAILGLVDLYPQQGGQAIVLSMYPNPSTNFLKLDFAQEGVYHLRLSDAQGQVKLEQKINSKKQILDLAKLPAGVYFLEVSSQQQRLVRRIVIQR